MLNLELNESIITDSNHFMRRMFRCWLDGSYNGEGHYHNNCEIVRSSQDKPSQLRAFVIGEWCAYLAFDNDCKPSTIQRHMVRDFTGGQLDRLNEQLIDDALDLIAD